MTARTGSTPRPSTQTPPEPPALTTDIAAALQAIPRRTGQGRRAPAVGEVWLQCDQAPDGWIRARVIEIGMGSMTLLAHQPPTLGRGTWARLAAPATPGHDVEQIRVFPLAQHAVGTANTGPFAIECETPADQALVARFLR